MEAWFDVIGMHGNVMVKEGDVRISDVCKKIYQDQFEGAIQLFALFGRGHDNGDDIHCGLFSAVEDKLILLAFIDKVSLRGECVEWIFKSRLGYFR